MLTRWRMKNIAQIQAKSVAIIHWTIFAMLM